MSDLSKAAVLGTGSWGTSFGRHLAATWDEVALWGIVPEQVHAINADRLNPAFLPGIVLPANLRATLDLADAVAGAQAVFVAVPSQAVRGAAAALAQAAPPAGCPVINLAKGMEIDTLKRLSEVLREEVGRDAAGGAHPVAVLLGPSHAEEVARGLPTAVVLSGEPGCDWQAWQQKVAGPTFRVYTNHDLVGVELASAFKNVIAIASGMCDGLGLGDNSRGAVLTRGLAELTRLSVALGGERATCYGLAGIGDLITTCTSRYSRNRNFGEAVGRGEQDPQAILSGSVQVVEGVAMTRAALKLGEKLGIPLPITQEVHRVVFAGKPPLIAMRDLMEREPRSEVE